MENSNNNTPKPTPTPSGNGQLFTCKIEEHYSQPLNIICTQETCPKNGLICADCMTLEHGNHINKCLSWNVYLNKIKKSYLATKEDKQNKINEFRQTHQNTMKGLSNTLEKVNLVLNELIKSQQEFYDSSDMELEKLLNDNNEDLLDNIVKFELKSFNESEERLNSIIKGFIKQYQIDNNSHIMKKSDEANFQDLDMVLKDSVHNFTNLHNFLQDIDKAIIQKPKLKAFKLQGGSLDLKKLTKTSEYIEPTGLSVMENILIYLDDLNLFATGNKNGEINIREYKTGKLLYTLKDGGYEISSLYYIKPLKKLISAKQNFYMNIWDCKTWTSEQKLSGLKDMMLSYTYLPEQEILISGDGIGWIYFWDMKNNCLLKTIEGHKKNWIKCILLLQDNVHIATSGSDNMIKIWKLIDENKNLMKIRDFPKQENPGRMILYDNDMIIYTTFGKFNIYNWKTGVLIKTIQLSKSNIVGLHYLERYKLLITCSNDHKIKSWNINTWEQENEFDTGSGICSTALFEDEQMWLITYGNNKVLVFKSQE